MTLGFALVSALVFLAWLTDRTVLLWPAFALSLAFASGLSLSGHSAADAGSSWLSQLADWAHLAAASLWVGGLVQLAFVVWPLEPELRRRAFLRFSRLATVLIVVMLSAGIYLSVLRLPQLARPLELRYGQVLLVKLRSSRWPCCGERRTTSSCARPSSAARRSSRACPAASRARAPSGWRSCSSRPCSSTRSRRRSRCRRRR